LAPTGGSWRSSEGDGLLRVSDRTAGGAHAVGESRSIPPRVRAVSDTAARHLAYVRSQGPSLLFLGHATSIRDPVFTLVQVVNVLALSTVVLARRYSGQLCELHAQRLRSRDQGDR
jgi:hypothetical protein